MGRKKLLQKMRSLILIVIVLLVSQNSMAYDIVTYGLTTVVTSTSVDVPANAGKSFTTTAWSTDGSTANTISFASSTAVTSKWDAANGGSKCWKTAAFSTFGYHTIGVSASMKSDNNAGPRDFNLEYSIDNGTSWHLVNSFTVSASSVAKTGTLPQVCQNQASVMLRWINTSNSAVGTGTVIATGKSYIKTVSIGGLLPVTPATQAHDLNVISRTPTTITVGWTKGVTADSVVVMMNTTNSFTTLPVNDQNFTAMTGTYTSGRQVIYVGNHSTFTVNVPNATDQYYFRAFDYQTNNGMARYITTSSDADPVVLNPILCDLENITLNASTFRLTRATLGATIQAPKKSAISERGIYWSYSPGVTESNYPLNDYNDADGSFNFPNEIIGRAVTIYYKGYAINESGTIWTAEATLNNTPIFSGTGTWGTAALWNVQEVPGANGDATYGSSLDSPIINGICTLAASNNVTDLVVNSGKKLTISPEVKLQVDGTLANNAGTSGLVIKASSTAGVGNGSLVFADPSSNSNVQATVEMYSRASYNLLNSAGNKYKWQYFGIPVTTLAYSPTFNSAYVRQWDESVTSYYDIWVQRNNGTSLMLASGASLSPGYGYELVQSGNKPYSFTGTLVISDFNMSLPYTSSAYYKGQTVLSNPYVAGMDITKLSFGSNTEHTVYLYNTGTYNDWLTTEGAQSQPGSGPGTYIVSTPGTAGVVAGVPTHIPSMQGFIVKSTATGGGSISLNYSTLNLTSNTDAQRIKSSSAKISTMIDVIGTNFSDRMWVMEDANCTRSFDNGYDGPKVLGYAEVSQLYGLEDDGIYQIDAVNDLNNTYLGFQPGTETNFKLVFKHQNTETKYSSIYLVDLVANTTTDISQSGTEYQFAATSTDAIKRFKIVTTVTGLNKTKESANLNVFNTNNTIVINNNTNSAGKLSIFDTMGKTVQVLNFNSNGLTTIPTTLNKGTYILKAVVDSERFTKCIIIN